MKSSSFQPDESLGSMVQAISAADEIAAITSALNALYATQDSSLELQIEALMLEALRSDDWRG